MRLSKLTLLLIGGAMLSPVQAALVDPVAACKAGKSKVERTQSIWESVGPLVCRVVGRHVLVMERTKLGSRVVLKVRLWVKV